MVGEFVSVYVDDMRRRVVVSCDYGRVCRPMIIVDPVTRESRVTPEHIRSVNTHSHPLSLHGFIKAGLIEYIDVLESNNTNVGFVFFSSGHSTASTNRM